MKITKATAMILCLVLLSVCRGETSDSRGGVDFQSLQPPASKAKFGDDLLDFTAPKLGGGQVVGNDFAGKDLVIWFWAPW